MKLPSWAIWVALALAVLMGALIARHALRHSPDEGLTRDRTTGCSHAWRAEDAPIPVTLDAASGEREEDVRAAVAWWNAELRGGVLTYAGRAPIEGVPGITVLESFNPTDLPAAPKGVDLERGDVVWGKTVHLYAAGCRKVGAAITLRGDPTRHPAGKRRDLMHELGHALGLGHDLSAVGRLMHPDARFQAGEVSAADLAQLRAAMGLVVAAKAPAP